jgi:hypothetical protein
MIWQLKSLHSRIPMKQKTKHFKHTRRRREKKLNELTVANKEMRESMAHLAKLLNTFILGKSDGDEVETADVTQSPQENQKIDSAKRSSSEPTPTSTPIANKDPKRRNTSDSPSKSSQGSSCRGSSCVSTLS